MKPGITWMGVAGAVLALTVAAVCVRLGVWQLDRLELRRERNAAYARAISHPPLHLTGDTLAAVRDRPDQYVYRRARLPGDPRLDDQVIWRGRSLNGRPGVNVLTPYRTPGGVTVMVNRGWAPSPDASRVDLEELAGPASGQTAGVLILLPTGPDRAHPARLEAGREPALSVRVPDPTVLAEQLGEPILPLYLQRTETADEAGLPTPLPLPDLDDEGPHLGYAIQWFAFASIAVFGFLTVLVLRFRSPDR